MGNLNFAGDNPRASAFTSHERDLCVRAGAIAGERAGPDTVTQRRQYSQRCMLTAARQCQRCCWQGLASRTDLAATRECARAVLSSSDGRVSAAQADCAQQCSTGMQRASRVRASIVSAGECRRQDCSKNEREQKSVEAANLSTTRSGTVPLPIRMHACRTQQYQGNSGTRDSDQQYYSPTV